MKGTVTIFLFIALLFSSTGYAQQLETTRDSIIHTINNETRYFATGEYEKWKSLWAHSPKALHTGASKDGFSTRKGWESIHSSFKSYIQDPTTNVPKDKLTISRKNFKIVTEHDMAFVHFISSGNLTPDAPVNDKMESRVLQRIDGKWKILYVNTIEISTYEE